MSVISEHDPSSTHSLFLYVSFQGVHSPAEVPQRYQDMNSGIDYDVRRVFAGMVSAVDEGIGNVTKALTVSGLLDHSIVVVTSDNGGPIDRTVSNDAIGSSNFPYRGGAFIYFFPPSLPSSFRQTNFVFLRPLFLFFVHRPNV